ncbi:hypothetical protein SETIT_3G180400v2 [Setaria italica]|uniref:Uncharacterized protein n=1 Tax=Setaria italica TaxID=4555 RepID=A0A368QGU1_SETIT|nr:hypothetical protein SETIT_3G180400v2 [Setaria italica]
MPITLEGGMCLLHTFEKEFDGDMWSTLTKKLLIMCPNVSSPLLHSMDATNSPRVLTSASLVRKADSNEIDDNLAQIEVYLPNNRHAKGRLQHYSIHYNIALISIRNFRCHRTAKFNEQVGVEPPKKAGIVGPLIDYDGNFIGMNFYDTEETPCLPTSKVLPLLRQFNGEGYVLYSLRNILD